MKKNGAWPEEMVLVGRLVDRGRIGANVDTV